MGIVIEQNEQKKRFFLSTICVSTIPPGCYFVRIHLTLDTLATVSKPFGGKHKKRVSVLDVRRVYRTIFKNFRFIGVWRYGIIV